MTELESELPEETDIFGFEPLFSQHHPSPSSSAILFEGSSNDTVTQITFLNDDDDDGGLDSFNESTLLNV